MVNWLNKVIRAGERIKAEIRKRATKEELAKSNYVSCCKGLVSKKEISNNYHTCPYCSKHFKVTPSERFGYLFDSGVYETYKTPQVKVDDPLNFVAAKRYIDQLKSARKKTGLNCSMVVASGEINKIKCTVVASDFMFMGSSIEQNEGEAVLFSAMHSIQNKQPLIIVAQGGGMRMQASMLSLSQMPRTTLAINEVKAAGLPYIVIMSNPVAGGITASYAMLGDIHIAEPGATVAFAGRRVIQGTVREELPSGFQLSEAVLEAGFIDRICHRKNLNEEIGKLLSILLQKNSISTEEKDNLTPDVDVLNKEAS